MEKQKVARENRVVMYRRYRDGDLPDIQMKHSDLIAPLQALAQASKFFLLNFSNNLSLSSCTGDATVFLIFFSSTFLFL